MTWLVLWCYQLSVYWLLRWMFIVDLYFTTYWRHCRTCTCTTYVYLSAVYLLLKLELVCQIDSNTTTREMSNRRWRSNWDTCCLIIISCCWSNSMLYIQSVISLTELFDQTDLYKSKLNKSKMFFIRSEPEEEVAGEEGRLRFFI